MQNSKLEIVPTPFKSLFSAINFYNLANPARIKSVNMLEPEGRSTAPRDVDPADLWAAVCLAIQAALSDKSAEERAAFAARNIGDTTRMLAVEDIALALHRSPQTIYRYLSGVYDALERELVRRELLEAQEISENDSK